MFLIHPFPFLAELLICRLRMIASNCNYYDSFFTCQFLVFKREYLFYFLISIIVYGVFNRVYVLKSDVTLFLNVLPYQSMNLHADFRHRVSRLNQVKKTKEKGKAQQDDASRLEKVPLAVRRLRSQFARYARRSK